MEDLKQIMRSNYVQYASYVILDRAIPNVVDGLKPVQRRILHTLWKIDDGKFHKVANVAGQTMAYHPHGEAAIVDALVNVATKNFLLDKQGNFGSIFTGDPSAAPRYIETRLSPLAKETLFNADLTKFITSYDGRYEEPLVLPSKLPILLLQGASGIAVGMSTNILPHNFCELLEAQIGILEGREDFEIYPDFQTGGILDPTQYNKGNGKVKVRAKLELRDPKTIVITQICHGTTTESLIRSIDEAAKRGRVKIDSINDYTAERVEIEITMPRGYYAKDQIDHLFAYTECEVSLSPQTIVIKDEKPWETDVNQMLIFQTHKLKEYLKKELEIEKKRIQEEIFRKNLEKIFIEKKIYKKIETISSIDVMFSTIKTAFKPHLSSLYRKIQDEDIEKLLAIPIRRISRYDLDKNKKDVKALHEREEQVDKNLRSIKRFTIRYLKNLLERYGKFFPRRTRVQKIKVLDKKAIAKRVLKVGVDLEKGFIGTKVSGDRKIVCTNFDKLLLFYQDGSYQVINIPEKMYVHQEQKQMCLAMVADKKSVVNVFYKDEKTHECFAKRFVIKQFILDKWYRYLEDGMELLYISHVPKEKLKVHFLPKLRQKKKTAKFDFSSITPKGVTAKGKKACKQPIKRVEILKETKDNDSDHVEEK